MIIKIVKHEENRVIPSQTASASLGVAGRCICTLIAYQEGVPCCDQLTAYSRIRLIVRLARSLYIEI